MVRETDWTIVLESLKDVSRESTLVTLVDLSEAASAVAAEEYLAENSKYELDEDAISEYVNSYMTAIESTAAAQNTTTTQLIH